MTLLLVWQPSGPAQAASPRFIEALSRADVVIVEDRWATPAVLAGLGVPDSCEVISAAGEDWAARVPELVRQLAAGSVVAVLVTAPAAPRPGGGEGWYQLVRAAGAAGLAVTSVPGPNPMIAALALSGLPSDRFRSAGYLPAGPAARRAALLGLDRETRTVVCSGSVRLAREILADLVAVFGPDRPAAAVRGLGTTPGDALRGQLGDLLSDALSGAGASAGPGPVHPPTGPDHPIADTITFVLRGAAPATPAEPEAGDLALAVARLVAEGTQRKEATALVATRYRVPKRTVYDAVLRHRAAR